MASSQSDAHARHLGCKVLLRHFLSRDSIDRFLQLPEKSYTVYTVNQIKILHNKSFNFELSINLVKIWRYVIIM